MNDHVRPMGLKVVLFPALTLRTTWAQISQITEQRDIQRSGGRSAGEIDSTLVG